MTVIERDGKFRVKREDGRISRHAFATEFQAKMAADSGTVLGWVKDEEVSA